jgi:hypothetical protein
MNKIRSDDIFAPGKSSSVDMSEKTPILGSTKKKHRSVFELYVLNYEYKYIIYVYYILYKFQTKTAFQM